MVTDVVVKKVFRITESEMEANRRKLVELWKSKQPIKPIIIIPKKKKIIKKKIIKKVHKKIIKKKIIKKNKRRR